MKRTPKGVITHRLITIDLVNLLTKYRNLDPKTNNLSLKKLAENGGTNLVSSGPGLRAV